MTEMKSALVTGASSGIGAACVRALRASDMKVWAMARRADRLEALAAETGCIPLIADIQDAEALGAALQGVDPDVLVNNAGLGAGIASLLNASREDIERTIGTNVMGLLDLTRLVVPGMITRGHGHVVTIGSVSGLYPSSSAIYGASKAAVTMIGRNLRLELRGTGVRVTDIRPGRVSTEFYDVAIEDPEAAARTKDTGIRELAPAEIADAVLYAVMAPAHVNVSAIELQPLEQTYGGVNFDPVQS